MSSCKWEDQSSDPQHTYKAQLGRDGEKRSLRGKLVQKTGQIGELWVLQETILPRYIRQRMTGEDRNITLWPPYDCTLRYVNMHMCMHTTHVWPKPQLVINVCAIFRNENFVVMYGEGCRNNGY